MSESRYYKDLYKQKKKEIDEYEDQIKDLRKILDNLTDTMSDEIRGINKELEALKSDLKKSVRHNSKFTIRTNELTHEKEKYVESDRRLRVVVGELEDEISRLQRLKDDAMDEKIRYETRYEEAKEKERKELLDKLF